jgi:ketosteroid isomerase-like protein
MGIVSLALVGMVGSAGQVRADEDREEREAIREVKHAGNRLVREIERRDASDLRDLLTRDFVGIGYVGEKFDRGKMITLWTRGMKLGSLKREDVKIKIHGRTAIETGRYRATGTYADDNQFNDYAAYTWVWVKHGKHWRLTSMHSGRVAE